ncbi:hypothetical protein BU17DRAFT_51034, partial [Hysterangium stoloniferum]
GEHVEVIKSANESAQVLSDVLTKAKGMTRLTSDDDTSDKLVAVAKTIGDVALRFFINLWSYKLELVPVSQRRESVLCNKFELLFPKTSKRLGEGKR